MICTAIPSNTFLIDSIDCRVSPFSSTTRHEGCKKAQCSGLLCYFTPFWTFSAETARLRRRSALNAWSSLWLLTQEHSATALRNHAFMYICNSCYKLDDPCSSREQKAGSGHTQEELQLSHLSLKQLKQQRLQLLCIQLDLICPRLSFFCLHQAIASNISVTNVTCSSWSLPSCCVLLNPSRHTIRYYAQHMTTAGTS